MCGKSLGKTGDETSWGSEVFFQEEVKRLLNKNMVVRKLLNVYEYLLEGSLVMN